MHSDHREFINRRAFLGLSSAGLFALTSRQLALRGAGADRLDKIGLQLYTVRDAMEREVEATLARVAAIGYREVEFAGYFGRTPAQVRALLTRNGLTAPSAHVEYGTIIKGQWDQVLDEALAVGHQYVVVAWIDEDQRSTLDAWKRVAERLNTAAEAAKRRGLLMAYHNHSYEFDRLDGQTPYDLLLATTDPKLVLLEMDLYWVTKGGRDPLDYFVRWPGRIRLVHIKDSKGPPDHVMTEVGAGVIPWASILGRHRQAGIEHYFVEHDDPKDSLASAEASYRYLRALKF
ncbi:MAG: sugar phosphate isomerase/epimerase [Gemmatimonadota bacterium]